MMTSNIDAAKIGKGLGVLHELEEQTSLFRTVTKQTFSLRASDDPYATMKKALHLTRSNRPGPVYMEVPHDLWGNEVTVSPVSQRDGHSVPLPSRIEDAVALLRRAKQPVIIIGTDAARANLAADITALAEALSAPVVGSTSAKGVLAEDHPLSFGNVARRMVVKEICQVVTSHW